MIDDPHSAAIHAFLDGEGSIEVVEQEFAEWHRTQKLYLSLMQDFGRDPSLLPRIVQIAEERHLAKTE